MARMNKQDWTLLLVRGFGLYLIMQALFSIPPFLGLGYMLCANWGSVFPKGEVGNIAERLQTELLTSGISVLRECSCTELRVST
jgi:hypothetical protein